MQKYSNTAENTIWPTCLPSSYTPDGDTFSPEPALEARIPAPLSRMGDAGTMTAIIAAYKLCKLPVNVVCNESLQDICRQIGDCMYV